MNKIASKFSSFDPNHAISEVYAKAAHQLQFHVSQLIDTLEGVLVPTECLQFYRDGKKNFVDILQDGLGHDYFPDLVGENKNLKYWDNYKRSKIMRANSHSIKIFSLNNYSSFWHVFKQSFDFSFFCESSLNYYYTPPKGQCFKVHSDPYDLFIIQTEGSKNWKVFNKHKDSWDEYLLNEGDILFIPKDVMHEAFTEDAPSGHVTLGFRPVPILDIVSTIKSKKIDPAPLEHMKTFDTGEMRYLSSVHDYFSKLTEYDIALHFIKRDISSLRLDYFLKEGFFAHKEATSFNHFSLNKRAYFRLYHLMSGEGEYRLLGNGHICEVSKSVYQLMDKLDLNAEYSKETLLKDVSIEELNLLLSVGLLSGH